MDNSNNANILRYPVGAETWQARRDVTITNETTGVITTYEGWLTDEAGTEVATGEITRMDKVRFGRLGNLDVNNLNILPGYLTDYQTVEITNGKEKMDLVFFTMKYFLNGDKVLNIKFSADKKFVDLMGFNLQMALGKKYGIACTMPIGNSFTEHDIKNWDIYELSQFEKEIGFSGSGSWIDASALLRELQYPKSENLDLIFKLRVEYFSPQ